MNQSIKLNNEERMVEIAVETDRVCSTFTNGGNTGRMEAAPPAFEKLCALTANPLISD